MPYIEDELKARENMWGEYHPTGRHKSCVMVRNVGCVFVGSVEECKQWMADNAHRYAGTHPSNRGRNPEVTV